MPTLSLTAAEWPLALRVIVPVVMLGVVMGYLLARSRYDEFFALIIGGSYGVVVVLMAAVISQPEGTLAQRTIDVVSRLVTWAIDAATGGINQEPLAFTVLVALLFWFLA